MYKNWFESRGLGALKYQDTAISKVLESLIVNEKTLFAACPSAGKTLMTTYIVEVHLKQNPDNKVMICTHGTTILRSQFHDALVEYKPNYTYALIESQSDYIKAIEDNVQVLVCLPQTLRLINELSKIDLLVVDEAHHFYLSPKAKMIKDIIRKTNVKKQLLLTGTPSKFIYENLKLDKDEYHLIPVTLNTIYDEGMVSEAYVEVASSNYNFDFDNYNDDNELKTSIHFKKDDTNKSLDDLLDKAVEKLRSFRGNPYANITPNWNIFLSELKKTMIACRSIEQAKQINDYFKKKNINTALSTSENDVDSIEIKRFKDETDCLVLIVVYRGILGFNMENLVNVIDMTMSHNIDRIYQLFSRVVRVDRKNLTQKKLFLKVASNMLTDYFKHIMTAVLMPTEEEFFTKYNGKNFNDMEIPIKNIPSKENNKNNTDKSDDDDENTKIIKTRKYQPIDMEGLPVFEFFKNILHKKGGLLTTYCMTTIREVRAEFLDYTPKNYVLKGYWTFDKVKEIALTCKTRGEFKIYCSGAYDAACRNNWLDEICNHMIEIQKPNGYWTFDKVKEVALICKTRGEFIEKYGSAYNIAIRNNWLDEIYSHMIEIQKPNGYWTFDKVKEVALTCKSRGEFMKKYSGAYSIARRNKWLDEICLHMIEILKPKRYWNNINNCKNAALECSSRSEFKKKYNGAYNMLNKNNWLDEACSHMVNKKIINI